MPPAPTQAYSDFQIKALLERVLRRPLWQVRREGFTYHVWTTAWERPVVVPWRDLADSMATGNLRPSQNLQKILLEFHNTGIPDKDGRDISGRVTPPETAPKKKGLSSLLRMLFGGSSSESPNGAQHDGE